MNGINTYATADALRSRLNLPASVTDDTLLAILAAASREIEGPSLANRVFYTFDEARIFDGVDEDVMLIDDLLAATAVEEDQDADGTFGTTWTEGTDFRLAPVNRFPKTRLEVLPNSTKALALGRGRMRVTGTWGYGDGWSASPWKATGIDITAADATTESATAAAAGIKAGDTLLVGSEQMFVRTVASDVNLTVTRAVNKTSGAEHSGAASKRALYPDDVIRACLWLAAEEWNLLKHAGLGEVEIGEYRIKVKPDPRTIERLFNRVRKGAL